MKLKLQSTTSVGKEYYRSKYRPSLRTKAKLNFKGAGGGGGGAPFITKANFFNKNTANKVYIQVIV